MNNHSVTRFHLIAAMLVAGLLLSATCHAETCDSQPSPYVARALNTAALAIEQQQPKQALETLLKASEWVGARSHHTLEFQLGVQLVQAEQATLATRHFQHATTLCRSFAPAWQNLGRSAFESQQFDLAADALEQAFVLTGSNRADLRYFQALARYNGKRWGDTVSLATSLFHQFAEQSSADWAELLAAAASQSQQQATAIALLHQQTAKLGANPRFRRVMANLLLQQQRYHEAMIQLIDLDHLGALNDGELAILADLYRMENLPLDAAASYHRLAQRTGATEALLTKQVESLMAGFKPAQALAVLEQGLSRWDSERLWLLAGQLRFETQQLLAAQQAFEKVLVHSPDNGHALLMVGYLLYLQDDFNAAQPWLRRAAKQPKGEQAVALLDYVNRVVEQRQQQANLTPPAATPT